MWEWRRFQHREVDDGFALTGGEMSSRGAREEKEEDPVF